MQPATTGIKHCSTGGSGISGGLGGKGQGGGNKRWVLKSVGGVAFLLACA